MSIFDKKISTDMILEILDDAPDALTTRQIGVTLRRKLDEYRLIHGRTIQPYVGQKLLRELTYMEGRRQVERSNLQLGSAGYSWKLTSIGIHAAMRIKEARK